MLTAFNLLDVDTDGSDSSLMVLMLNDRADSLSQDLCFVMSFFLLLFCEQLPQDGVQQRKPFALYRIILLTKSFQYKQHNRFCFLLRMGTLLWYRNATFLISIPLSQV